MSKIVNIKIHKPLGISPERAEELFAIIDKFAGYGFNKSHAAAYALLGWQTAWLKQHHPAAFYAAALTYVGSHDKLRQIVREAQDLGVTFLPPSPIRSRVAFYPEVQEDGSLAVRWGLGSIKGLGRYAATIVEACFGKPIETIEQLAQALSPYGSAGAYARALADAGALDAFHKNRRAAGDHLATCIEFERNQIGQTFLFDLESPAFPKTEDFTREEKREAEINTIGISFHEHPLAKAYPHVRRLAAVQMARLKDYVGMGAITVLARVEAVTKNGRKSSMLVRLSDATAEDDFLLDTEAPEPGSILICEVARKPKEERWRLVATSPYEPATVPRRARIDIRGNHNWEAIRSVLARHGRGKDRLDVMVELTPERKARKVLSPCFNLTDSLLAELSALEDVISVASL